MKYVKTFETHSEYESYIEDISSNLLPNVSYCKNTHDVHYNPYDYSKAYLTFEALEDGTFTFTMNAKLSTTCVPRIAYSTDNGETWTMTNNVDNQEVVVTTPTVAAGKTVLWKSNAVQFYSNPDPYPGSNVGYGSFTSSGNYNVCGNIMSLLYEDNFNENNIFKEYVSTGYGAGAFAYLFRNNTKLLSIKYLILSATTLANYCYSGMFDGCTSLATAPELPATTLAVACYMGMFRNCTSLTTAPVLPATTLANECYSQMFSDCTSLTSAPDLPVTTLALACYNQMFSGCILLTKVPELPATILAGGCYESMFSRCTSLINAPKLPAITLSINCYKGLFYGCTSLTTAPELPATTLATYCYQSMFQGCTSLTTPPTLPATTLQSNCYNSMFNSCTSLTTAPVLPATTLAQYCYHSMFSGCSLTEAPELPAITLVTGCYQYMFQSCSNLNYIKALFTTTPSADYTNQWVSGVSASGTFVKNSAASWTITGMNGIPTGWTVQTASE